MVESQIAGERAFWKADGHPLAIEYSLAMLDEICSAVANAFYCTPRGGVEVGGVLFGLRGENSIRILASRPMPCKYAAGPSYVLSPEDEAGLRRLLETSGAAPELKGLLPVGWFHSHTRSGLFLSDRDVEIYNRYFPEPWQVALVLQPGKLKPTQAGFFLREPDGSIRTESSYREFSVNPPSRPQSRAPRARRERKPLGPTVQERPATPPYDVEPPRFTMVAAPRKIWKRIGITLVLLAILSGAGVAVKIFWFSGPPPDLALRVSDSNAHLRIDWDRNASVIREAPGATLEIRDGEAKFNLALDRQQLQTGSVTYLRQGDSVSVRLIVQRSGAAPAEQVAMFLGQPVPPREAAREIEDLRSQLSQEAAKSQKLQQAMKALQRKLQQK